MPECILCGEEKASRAFKICKACIKDRFEEAIPIIEKVHRDSRRDFNLPEKPPKNGLRCGFCVNECRISQGEVGFCGVRGNLNGRIQNISSKAFVSCYYDPLPTNCVAMDFCEARSKRGVNLAVFYEACSFNCLFCQNWNYKRRSNVMSSKELALKVNSDTYCICFFGGDPTPQLDHALRCSKLALEMKDLKICFETNGSSSLPLLKKMAKLSFNSGGTIKIDLKAYDEKLNLALCGVSNKNTLLNFEYLSKFSKERENFLVASTLLVPGYIDHIEVEKLAKFISNLNPEIPYCLLAFHPHFLMRDLERTSRRDAKKCFKIAKKYLMRVRIGNWWLLS